MTGCCEAQRSCRKSNSIGAFCCEPNGITSVECGVHIGAGHGPLQAHRHPLPQRPNGAAACPPASFACAQQDGRHGCLVAAECCSSLYCSPAYRSTTPRKSALTRRREGDFLGKKMNMAQNNPRHFLRRWTRKIGFFYSFNV